MNIFKVILSEHAKRDLKKVPMHIAIKLYVWHIFADYITAQKIYNSSLILRRVFQFRAVALTPNIFSMSA
jgi:hypothetical protein